MTNSDDSKTASRSSRGSKEKILKVALREFSNKGLSGARVDRIAALAKTSKNMIYYHFGSKDGLYREVIRLAYADIRQKERAIDTSTLAAEDALSRIVETSFNYHCNNEPFVRMVMSENMNRAKHIIMNMESLQHVNSLAVEQLSDILERGQKEKVFRADIDPLHLQLTISALNFHFVSNRYTFSRLFGMDMTSKEAIDQRREEVVDVVLRWCRR